MQILSDCSVLISPEGGAGTLNMLMPSKSVLITIDFGMSVGGESFTMDGRLLCSSFCSFCNTFCKGFTTV